MALALRRLQQDLRKITNDPPPGISASISEDGNIFHWDAMIVGPGDTPFEGGTFNLRLQFPPDFPAKAPVVWFYSRMFHPNVYPNGKICLDILEVPEKWKSVYDGASILCAIQAMLSEPNPDDPANGEANKLFMTNIDEYKKRVAQIVECCETDYFTEMKNLNEEIDIDITNRIGNLDVSDIDGDTDALFEFLRKN